LVQGEKADFIKIMGFIFQFFSGRFSMSEEAKTWY
jgi:hypothetical protein